MKSIVVKIFWYFVVTIRYSTVMSFNKQGIKGREDPYLCFHMPNLLLYDRAPTIFIHLRLNVVRGLSGSSTQSFC